MPENPLRFVNIGLEVYSIVICSILVIYHCGHLKGSNFQKHWFIAMLLSNIGMMFGDLTDWMFNGHEGKMAVLIAPYGMCLFYGASGVILWCLMRYMLALMGIKNKRTGFLERTTTVLCMLQVLFSVLSLKNGMYFYYTPENVYIRGKFYVLSQVIPGLMYGTNVCLLYMGRHNLRRRNMFFLSMYIILPLVGQLLQSCFYGMAYINIMATIALLLMNINVQDEQELEAKKLENELAEMRIDIMLSQIRPHFLYNVLTAIRQLCDTDTEQAKEVILDFSRFLRANINSLSTKEPIPFERELEHVQCYLNLEKQRFGKRLNVVYDINARDFMIPTLTLQPIVENAVRHGIKGKKEGGTVKIFTEEWRDGYLIIVSDNGTGFKDREALGEEPGHIGLANVKRRIETQCGGKLAINSDSKGSRVSIWVPKVWRK